MLSSLLVQLCKTRTENEVAHGVAGPREGQELEPGAGGTCSRGHVDAGFLLAGDLSGTRVCPVALLRLGAERGASGGSCRPVTFKHGRDEPDWEVETNGTWGRSPVPRLAPAPDASSRLPNLDLSGASPASLAFFPHRPPPRA